MRNKQTENQTFTSRVHPKMANDLLHMSRFERTMFGSCVLFKPMEIIHFKTKMNMWNRKGVITYHFKMNTF